MIYCKNMLRFTTVATIKLKIACCLFWKKHCLIRFFQSLLKIFLQTLKSLLQIKGRFAKVTTKRQTNLSIDKLGIDKTSTDMIPLVKSGR